MRATALGLVLLLLAPSSLAGDRVHEAGGKGRQGYLPDGGPSLPEVSLVVRPPDGEAWVPDVEPLWWRGEIVGLTDKSIVAVDGSTGGLRSLAPHPPLLRDFSRSPWAVHDDRLYFAEPGNSCSTGLACPSNVPGALRIIRMDSGSEQRVPLVIVGAARSCSLAVDDAPPAVYTACIVQDTPAAISQGIWGRLEVRRLGLDGESGWSWSDDTDPQAAAHRSIQQDAHVAPFRFVLGLTIAAGRVIVMTASDVRSDPNEPRAYWEGWVLTKEGQTTAPPEFGESPSYFSSGYLGCLAPSGPTSNSPSMVVGDEEAWIRKDVFSCGLPNADSPVRATVTTKNGTSMVISLPGRDSGVRSAIAPHGFVVGTGSLVAAFSRGGEPTWQLPVEAGLRTSTLPILVDDARTFVFLERESSSGSRLAALDSANGRVVWTHVFDGAVRSVVGGPAAIVAVVQKATAARELVVVGASNASIPIGATTTNAYPGPAELVRVDLSTSGAGLRGAPTKYRADWGDGEETPWQSSPVLTHAYNAVGDQMAYVFAGNDAGQVSAKAVVFHVGQHDPAITILNHPFADEYQETTFFLLGLVATALVAALGVYRAGRKRRRFHHELRALEDGHRRLASDPRASDSLLSQRKSAARALFLEKRIEEAHASFLERRVDELRRGLRLGTIEDKLKFLPYGMVAQLQRILADAHVDEWERRHFVDALDAQTELSTAQRAKARRVIDDWFTRDAGASP